MRASLKYALATGLTVTGIGFAASSALALPMAGLDPAVATPADVAQGVQDVRWVCGPWGCHWAPNYWGWGYGWHRPWGWRGYGWHRGWRRW